jgi:hypothetical protein
MKLRFVFALSALIFTAGCGGSGSQESSVAAIANESKTLSLTDGIAEDLEPAATAASSQPAQDPEASTSGISSQSAQDPEASTSGISSQPAQDADPATDETSGVAVNHSLVAADNDYVFYARPTEGDSTPPQGELIRLDLRSGETKTLRDGNLQGFLALSKGWLYFSAASDNNLYKMSRDGVEEALTAFDSLEELSSMIAVGDCLYCSFQSPSDNQLKGIIKVNTETGETLQLLDSSVSSLAYLDGFIYFNNQDDNWSICKIRTDGSGQSKVNDENSMSLNIFKGKLYYINKATGEIISCGTNGESRTPVSKESADYRSLTVHDGKIFCSVAGDGIYSMDLEGNGVAKLAGLNSKELLHHDIGIANGAVYYEDARAAANGMEFPALDAVSLE